MSQKQNIYSDFQLNLILKSYTFKDSLKTLMKNYCWLKNIEHMLLVEFLKV